ncbi:MAG: glycosyltransferase family 9 protein [Candidatus Obscuribacterales bacterium]|nr:glycosyltransferase family 9 protein [Candidatus Obscuribacterales bacterium]
MKMLAINFGGLGDEVLFLPTLKSIRAEHQDWHITLLTEPRSRSITQLTDLIDSNICFDIKKKPLLLSDYVDLVKLIRQGKYDLVLSSGSSPQVAALLFLSGIPRRIGYDSGPLSRFLLTSAVPLNKNQYAGYMYHDLVHGLDITLDPEPPTITITKEAQERMSAFIAAAKPTAATKHRVLIHPGSSLLALQKGIDKTWSAANWSELIKQLLAEQCQVILAGGPDDEACIAAITAELNLSGSLAEAFINAYGKTKSVCDLAALMQLSDLIVCVDSAPMHIAAGLQKRVVALFGPTEPDKLLLQSDRVVALRDQSTNQFAEGVQLPPSVVYRSAADQLTRAAIQESSLEFRSN